MIGDFVSNHISQSASDILIISLMPLAPGVKPVPDEVKPDPAPGVMPVGPGVRPVPLLPQFDGRTNPCCWLSAVVVVCRIKLLEIPI